MGRDADQEIVHAVGLYDDDDLSGYVADVGTRLVATSERPYLPWQFRVLDDPSVNAFALPGGYVYVTRGILAQLDSEAELAAVLGHEIGHVTARHGVHAMSKRILGTAVVGTAAVLLDPDHADEWLDAGALTLGLVFLKHSRDDEKQADDLGLRYLLRAGYEPRDMPPVFEMLERIAAAEGGRLPTWLSTHPDPGARAARIARAVTLAEEHGERPADALARRDDFLVRLEGLAYGSAPGDAAAATAALVGAAAGPEDGGPARLTLVRLDEDLTLPQFAERFPSTVPLPELALLNRGAPDGHLPPGTIAKRVVGAPP